MHAMRYRLQLVKVGEFVTVTILSAVQYLSYLGLAEKWAKSLGPLSLLHMAWTRSYEGMTLRLNKNAYVGNCGFNT